jgi:hypothetical protein
MLDVRQAVDCVGEIGTLLAIVNDSSINDGQGQNCCNNLLT